MKDLKRHCLTNNAFFILFFCQRETVLKYEENRNHFYGKPYINPLHFGLILPHQNQAHYISSTFDFSPFCPNQKKKT